MPNSTSFDLAQYSFLISVPNGRYESPTVIIAWFSVLARTDGGWVWRQDSLSRVLQLLIRLAEAAAGNVCFSCLFCTC